MHDIRSLATKAVAIAPSAETKEKFSRMLGRYRPALAAAGDASNSPGAGASAKTALQDYEDIAEELHEKAEDGEITGRDVAQSYQQEIDRTSKRSVVSVTLASILGLVLAITFSLGLARAILVSVAHLREVAESVSMGDLDVSVKRHSQDEIGDLADSFSRMVTAVKFFRMEAEMVQAEPAGLEI